MLGLTTLSFQGIYCSLLEVIDRLLKMDVKIQETPVLRIGYGMHVSWIFQSGSRIIELRVSVDFGFKVNTFGLLAPEVPNF